jgi:GTP:adenosylcobinamide-phosphate guanylyltransferase
MDILILAGGTASPELFELAGQNDRALIDIGGEILIAPLLRAVREAFPIARIAVVGSDAVLEAARGLVPEMIPVAPGERMVDNLAAGAHALQSEQLLVCSCDIPLVTAAELTEFVDAARAKNLDIAYPVVARAVCESAFPGGRRTYARLREGEFTGGNAVLLPRVRVPALVELANVAYGARKNPARLARMLGAALVLKFVTKTLAIGDVEKRAARILGCHVGAVQVKGAAIAFDVDKPHDLEVVRKLKGKPEA